MMLRKLSVALVAASIALPTAALAQPAPAADGVRNQQNVGEQKAGRPDRRERHHRHKKLSAEDRAAFTDARIAAIHAGLKLTPDQEKNWPPVEAALRDLAKERADAMAQRRERKEANEKRDPIQRLRDVSDDLAKRSASLKRLADASAPLYQSLDDAQKRRLHVLSRQVMRPHGMGRGRDWR